MEEELKTIMVSQFSAMRKQLNVSRKYDEVSNDMKALWMYSPEYCVKLTFIIRGMCRKGLCFGKDGKKVLNVYGLNQRKEGTMRMYWILQNHPEVFYSNFRMYCILFGRWRDIIDIWSMELIRSGLDSNSCDINHGYITNVMLKDILNPCYGPDIAFALPTIRNEKDANTDKRKAQNIIGKYIRSKMPSNENTNQHSYYRAIKRAYGSKPNYNLFKPEMRGSDEELMLRMLKQKALSYINI